MNQILEILEKINPWWLEKKFDTGINRNTYLKKIKSFLKTKEILILSGVRRSGKTTLLFQTVDFLIKNKVHPKQILFVNFDEADIANLQNPIKTILDTYFQEVGDSEKKAYLIFDEIQSIDMWERYAKTIYDEKKYQLIVSGSSSHLLDKNLATLISGRYLKINAFPLDFREYLDFHHISIQNKLELSAKKNQILKLLKRFIFEGGFPKITLENNTAIQNEILKTYYESIIYRDILLMHNVRQKKVMKELIYYLISNFTSLFSYKNIAELLSADFSTIKEYISYLEESGAFFQLPIFSYSLKTQTRNNKKSYWIDNGLRNAVSFKFSKDEGRLAENMVFIELIRRQKTVYYWKNIKGQEVDFVIKNADSSLDIINVSYTNDIQEREINGLLAFKKEFNKTKDMIILTKDVEKKEKINGTTIVFIPLWKWLLA